MKVILGIIAVLLLLAGAVWFLQGINVIGGSVMTGQSQWVVIGALAFIVGIILLIFTFRRRSSPPQNSK